MAPPFRIGGSGSLRLGSCSPQDRAAPGIDPAFRVAGSPPPTLATAPGSGRAVTGPNTDELHERIPAPHALGVLAAPADLGEVVDAASRYRHQADCFAGCQVSGVLAIARRFPVRRWPTACWSGAGGAPAAAVVDPGLRPRFFSVLPTPANFRSR